MYEETGMSHSRDGAMTIIKGNAFNTHVHLVMLLMTDDDRLRRHWAMEVAAWMFAGRDIVVKPRNRRVPLRDYQRLLKPQYPFRSLVARAARHVENVRLVTRDVDEKRFETALEGVVAWMAQPTMAGDHPGGDGAARAEAARMVLQWTSRLT